MNKLIVFSIYLLTSLTIFTSCGADEEIELERSYLSVEDHLSSGDCDKALSKMLSMKEQSGDATYYKLLASSYACKAGFSVTEFFLNEITKITTGADLLSSMSTFTMAQAMTDIDDLSYYYLGQAIEVLTYSGGMGPATKDPSAALREATFGSYGAADINSFLMYMLFVRNGMSMAFFGNSDALGSKGAGTIGTNECLFAYSFYGDVDLDTYIQGGGVTGACDDGADTGSVDLTNGDSSLHLERACAMVTDFNNLLDVLENISLGDITDVDLSTFLADISAVRQDFVDNVITPKGFSNSLVTVKNQTQCVTDFTGSELQIAYYMAALFETLHSR